jgi:hypothetical protein
MLQSPHKQQTQHNKTPLANKNKTQPNQTHNNNITANIQRKPRNKQPQRGNRLPVPASRSYNVIGPILARQLFDRSVILAIQIVPLKRCGPQGDSHK